MKIKRLELQGQFTSNCYILYKDISNSCIVVDPGFNDTKLYNYLKDKDLIVEAIVLTHGHFDHWGGLKHLQKLYPNAKLYASTLDYYWYEIGPNNYFGYTPNIDFDLNNFSEIKLMNETIKVIKTPGHSAGSISLLINDMLISGDVIFKNGIGRTDLYEGDRNILFDSIQKIYKLDENITIYPGHGKETTIKTEKAFNPFIRG